MSVLDSYEGFFEYALYIPLRMKFTNYFDENLLYISKVITLSNSKAIFLQPEQ